MDVMILAAGQGTRLLPLTRKRPKPLFPILNTPNLQNIFSCLTQLSVEKVILNTHHLAIRIEEFVRVQKRDWPFEIHICFEADILGTGGGIKNMRDLCTSSPFLVINGDLVTDIDLKKAEDFHRDHSGPVTLILHDYPPFNQIAVEPCGHILDFRLEAGKGLAFTGIHILNQEIFDYLPSSGEYDIIPIYQQMIRRKIPIHAYISQGHYWRDIGTPGSYLKVHEELLAGGLVLENSLWNSRRPEGVQGVLVHPQARIEKGAVFSGWACIGKGCLLKEGCRIKDSVLWEGVVVERGSYVSGSILGEGVHVKNDLQGEVVI